MWWQHTADNKGIAIERTQVVNKRKTTSNDTFFVSTLLHKYPLNTNIVHSTVYARKQTLSQNWEWHNKYYVYFI